MPEIADVQTATPDVATPTSNDRAAESGKPMPVPVAGADAGIESELLIEDVSIDGMCGVY